VYLFAILWFSQPGAIHCASLYAAFWAGGWTARHLICVPCSGTSPIHSLLACYWAQLL